MGDQDGCFGHHACKHLNRLIDLSDPGHNKEDLALPLHFVYNYIPNLAFVILCNDCLNLS